MKQFTRAAAATLLLVGLVGCAGVQAAEAPLPTPSILPNVEESDAPVETECAESLTQPEVLEDQLRQLGDFAGMSFDQSSDSLLIAWHGAVPAAAVELVESTLADGCGVVFSSATYGPDELVEAQDALSAVSGDNELLEGVNLTGWGAISDGSGLNVYYVGDAGMADEVEAAVFALTGVTAVAEVGGPIMPQ